MPKIKFSNLSVFILAALITFLSFQNNKELYLPLTLEIADITDGNSNAIRIYNDLNNDGFSEHINFDKVSENNISRIIIWNYSGVIEEQFNMVGDIIGNGVIFGDVNSDNYKDIIVFYTNEDSLFFDAINPVSKSFIIKKQLFLTKPDSAIRSDWDIMISRGSAIVDINSDGKNELIVGLKTGYAIYPRGIYTYDFLKMSVTNKFEISASPSDIIIDDFDEDGDFEICFTTPISGNVNSSKLFNDQTSWVFFLDHNLRFVSKPKSYGKYPSSGISTQFLYHVKNEKKILLVETNALEKKSTIYQFDSKFLKTNETTIRYKFINSITALNENNEGPIYLLTPAGEIIELNKNLDQINNVITGLEGLTIIASDDFSRSRQEDIVLANNSELRIYSRQLKLLGKTSFNQLVSVVDYTYSTRKNGDDRNKQICISNNKSSILISVNRNEKQFLLFLLLLIIFITVSLVFFLIKKSILQFYYYLMSFRYLFFKTETGYCLVDNHLKIKYTNQNFINYLNLQNIEVKSLSELFIDHKNLIGLLQKAIESKKAIEDKLLINTPDLQFNGVINAIPLKIFRSKIIAILIELKNYTKPILDERSEIWGKSIQKIAHDIKTPLSTIALNLKAIQLKMEREGITNSEITNDINVAKSEIERIKNLTKDFLKFVDLDTPSMQIIELNEIIIKAIERYQSLSNDDFKIDTNLTVDKILVWADPRQIEMVLHILVENAIDALQGKGFILIEIELVQDLVKESVLLSISDNGPGVKKEIIYKIFEPHFSTKKDGTGMGLPFAKKIVKDHGGELTIDSQEQLGTTFIIKIPIYKMAK